MTMIKQSLAWGTIPTGLPDEPYQMKLNKSDLELVVGIVNQGIDSQPEAIFTEQEGDQVTIKDKHSMITFLRRCIDADDDNLHDLAGCVLSTLGYDWI